MEIWVGKEKGCDFSTIQAAVDAVERQSDGGPAAIYILSGVYEEAVRIYRSDLAVIGIGQAVIRMSRYARERDASGKEIGTFATPALFLGGSRLVVENVTVENSAGPGERVGQALALYAHCDLAVFRHCVFKGHQDTVFTGPLPPSPRAGGTFGGIPLQEHHEQYRQLYEFCRIEGNVDFIFGGATAYFERCEIHSLPRAAAGDPGYLTAASTSLSQEYGYVFRDCRLTAVPEVSEGSVYLGRPWREYAKTAFVGCRYGPHIHPQGWDNWGDPSHEVTVRYGEYGMGGDTDELRPQRAAWAECSERGEEAWTREKVFGEAAAFFERCSLTRVQ